MKNITMDEMLSRYTHEACYTGNLFPSVARAEIADQTIGLLLQNGKMRVKDIREKLDFDTTPQLITSVLRNLVMMGKVKREVVESEPITVTTFSFWTGKDETRTIIPTIAYYSLA